MRMAKRLSMTGRDRVIAFLFSRDLHSTPYCACSVCPIKDLFKGS